MVKKLLGLAKEEKEPVEYPDAFDAEFDGDHEEATWKKYIKEKDRDTMRLPPFGKQWMPSIPFVGQKVDTIYYCRKELARLNAEIEEDQAHPERFPPMNSAFIQFNHQVAAHMACGRNDHPLGHSRRIYISSLPTTLPGRHVLVAQLASPGSIMDSVDPARCAASCLSVYPDVLASSYPSLSRKDAGSPIWHAH